MVLHAMCFSPFRITAGALGKMAGLRSYDAGVTFRQAAHTGETVALCKAFTGLTTAMDAIDQAFILQ